MSMLEGATSAVDPRGIISSMQGPVKPWETDEEAEQYAIDPKAYLLARCAKLMKAIEMGTNHCLVATFFLPEFATIKGPNGPLRFYMSDKTKDEAMWQGRVGLLLAKGPLCWKDDEVVKFGGTRYEVGEWVVYDRQDGRAISINRVHCRRLRDVDVWAGITDPAAIY